MKLLLFSLVITGQLFAKEPEKFEYKPWVADINNILRADEGFHFNSQGKPEFSGKESGWNMETDQFKLTRSYSRVDKADGSTKKRSLILKYKNKDLKDIERVTKIRDKDRADETVYSFQDAQSILIENGKVSSYTSCSIYVGSDSQNEAKKSNVEKALDLAGKLYLDQYPKDRLTVSCFTANSGMCENLKKVMKVDKARDLKGKFEACGQWLTDFENGVNGGTDYFETETKGEEDLKSIFDRYEKFNNLTGIKKIEYRDFNSYAKRGGRAEARDSFRRLSNVIELCDDIEFYEKSAQGAGASKSGVIKQ